MTDRSAPSSKPRAQAFLAALGLVLLALAVAAAGMGYASPVECLAGLGGIALGGVLGWAARQWRAPGVPQPAAATGGAGVTSGDTLRAITALLVTPAFVINSESRVLTHNARARDHFTSIEDGQPLHQVSRHPGVLEAVARTRETGVAQSGEMAERSPGGRRLLVTVSPLQSGGQVVLLVQFRDLSEQDRLAQSRSDFIANASHELRTPLASLKGFIETLQGPASGDTAARIRFLTIMEAQAARMARILDDLLSLSRIEMRAHVAPIDEIDAGAIVRATVQGLEPIAREAKMTLKLDAITQPFLARGDRDELEQVFQNLIQNALKYGKEGGTVAISVSRREPVPGPASSQGQGGRIAVAVADDGPGITEEHLPRLTERFYRVDTAASRERGGTGLGLAIVKHILNRHRGELLIASVPGQGSTFTVILDALSQTSSSEGGIAPEPASN